MIIILSILFFAMFDYIGYNLAVRYKLVNSKFINPYRITQALMQIAITLTLYFLWSWKEAVSFNFLWWTWTADLIFYIYCYLINGFNHEFAMQNEVQRGIVTWGWWTPYGLIKWAFTGKQQTQIGTTILVLQSIIGMILTLLFNTVWQNI